MKVKIFLSSLIFLLSPVFALAASEVEIFSRDYVTDPAYLNSGIEWGVYNNDNKDILFNDEGALIQNEGDAYLVYPVSFDNKDFDSLVITLKSDTDLAITLIPNVGTTGYNTYELQKNIKASQEFSDIEFSLRLPFFDEPTKDIGIRLYSGKDSQVVISQIKLIDKSFGGVAVQAVKDYFLPATYSSFTVNLIPTPRIFGYSAMIYLLPIVIVALLLLFLHPKKSFRKNALIILVSFWILVDLRMIYEFINYNIKDYQNYVAPEIEEKSLRNYEGFYQFAEMVKQSVPVGESVNFYNFGSDHFPRILQYEIYPSIVLEDSSESSYFAFYQPVDIYLNSDDQKLYREDKALTEAGEVIATLNNSFIFKKN